MGSLFSCLFDLLKLFYKCLYVSVPPTCPTYSFQERYVFMCRILLSHSALFCRGLVLSLWFVGCFCVDWLNYEVQLAWHILAPVAWSVCFPEKKGMCSTWCSPKWTHIAERFGQDSWCASNIHVCQRDLIIFSCVREGGEPGQMEWNCTYLEPGGDFFV